MPDLYADIENIPAETQSVLAYTNVMRARDPVMASIRKTLFDSVEIDKGSRVLEIGCGPGDVLEEFMAATSAAAAVGVDPSPVMIETAMDRHGKTAGLSFRRGDGRDLDFGDASFDAVLFHTTLVHLPRPEAALAEAFRVLKPGGRLVVFEGDYATATAAIGANDPLELCMKHAVANMVHDPYFCRTIRTQCTAAGFQVDGAQAHPYKASGDPTYFLTVLSRGADFLAGEGLLSGEAAELLKADAMARAESGRFFGFILYMSLLATKP